MDRHEPTSVSGVEGAGVDSAAAGNWLRPLFPGTEFVGDWGFQVVGILALEEADGERFSPN